MRLSVIKNLDSSVQSFEIVKAATEKKWQKITYYNNCWGAQIQKNSKWKKGLTEDELEQFQKEMKIEFPEELKNFYSTMNGLDQPSLEFDGDLKNTPVNTVSYYSYPEDIALIKERIGYALQDMGITLEDIRNGKAPFVFPFLSNRFIVFDENKNVLSIAGRDIIPWAENLTKSIVRDEFDLSPRQIMYLYGSRTSACKILDGRD